MCPFKDLFIIKCFLTVFRNVIGEVHEGSPVLQTEVKKCKCIFSKILKHIFPVFLIDPPLKIS